MEASGFCSALERDKEKMMKKKKRRNEEEEEIKVGRDICLKIIKEEFKISGLDPFRVWCLSSSLYLCALLKSGSCLV